MSGAFAGYVSVQIKRFELFGPRSGNELACIQQREALEVRTKAFQAIAAFDFVEVLKKAALLSTKCQSSDKCVCNCSNFVRVARVTFVKQIVFAVYPRKYRPRVGGFGGLWDFFCQRDGAQAQTSNQSKVFHPPILPGFAHDVQGGAV